MHGFVFRFSSLDLLLHKHRTADRRATKTSQQEREKDRKALAGSSSRDVPNVAIRDYAYCICAFAKALKNLQLLLILVEQDV